MLKFYKKNNFKILIEVSLYDLQRNERKDLL